jgi:hypothetical protein
VPVTSDGWVQNTIRLAGVAAFGASAYVFSIDPGCGGLKSATVCPGYAFGSPWLLRSERAILALAILVALLTVFIRVVIIGTVPDNVGQTGAAWTETPEIISKMNKTTKDQNETIARVRDEAERLTSKTAADAAVLIGELENRVAGVEAAVGPNPMNPPAGPIDKEGRVNP